MNCIENICPIIVEILNELNNIQSEDYKCAKFEGSKQTF
jgi:hypothetical protein